MSEPLPVWNATCHACPDCGEPIGAGYEHECQLYELEALSNNANSALIKGVPFISDGLSDILVDDDDDSPPTLTAEHLEALHLVATHYGFWHGKDWPPDRIRRLITEVREAIQ